MPRNSRHEVRCRWELQAGLLLALLGSARLAAAQDDSAPVNPGDEQALEAPRPRLLLRATGKPRVAGSQVSVPLALSLRPDEVDEQAKVETSHLLVVAGRARLQQAADGSSVVEQPKATTSVLSSTNAKEIAAASLVTTAHKTSLPWLVVDSAQPDQEPVRSARPYLQLARAVRWDAQKHVHIAEFRLGLDAERGSEGKLAEPIDASLSVSCDAVSPENVTLDEIGPAGERRVTVSCSPKVKNERNPQTLSVRLQSGALDYPFELPHRPGAFVLVGSTPNVMALGLGELTLTVYQTEEDGTPLKATEALRVPLRVSDGELDPDSLLIAPGADQAAADVRVRGSGQLLVFAGVSERQSSAVSVRVRWPVLLSFLTPLGGAVGGYLSRGVRRKKSTPRGRRGMRTAMAMLEGALVGTLVVLAVLVIPSFAPLPEWARTTEVAWFTVAAFAGFLGLELFDRLARLFFRSSEPSEAVKASE